jgi:type I restriction enzyme S subunit
VNPATPEFDRLPSNAEVPFLPLECIWPGELLDTTRRKSRGEAVAGYTRFREGDILLPKITPTFQADRTVIAVGLEGGVGVGTTELHVVRVGPVADTRYIRYLMSSRPFLELGEASMFGVAGQKRVPDDHVRNFPVPITDIDRQRIIADYLDRETGRIDALIAAKTQMIEALRERSREARTLLVLGASYRGARDSGPRWLGDLPAHWQVQRLKYIARMDSGHTPDRKVPEYWMDCEIPWVTLNDVGALHASWEIREPANAINELGMAHSAAHVLPAGSVILSRDATVGRAAILGKPMAVSQHFVSWTCTGALLPEYLLNVFRGPMQAHLRTLTAGATIATIGMPELRELVVPVPLIAEQNEIVREIRNLERVHDQTTSRLIDQASLLHERRQALITAAVTGELEIPEVAA